MAAIAMSLQPVGLCSRAGLRSPLDYIIPHNPPLNGWMGDSIRMLPQNLHYIFNKRDERASPVIILTSYDSQQVLCHSLGARFMSLVKFVLLIILRCFRFLLLPVHRSCRWHRVIF